jgi:MFS family permease
VVAGLVLAASGGALYLLAVAFEAQPWVAVSLLLVGRALLGGAESFIITGAVSWGLALAGHAQAGRVIAWIGMAMFAALASGAPIGTALYSTCGFASLAMVTAVLPLLTLLIVAGRQGVPPGRATTVGFLKVIRAVWLPGVGSALSTVGFGAMIGFSSLLSTERDWSPAWLVFSTFAASLVVARLTLGHLPDRVGGARAAFASVLVEALGLAMLWLSPGRTLAVLGAALAGFGYALVYPGLGAEAVSQVPSQSRGLAMGCYTVFLDVALGFGSPALGVIAGARALGTVFLASMVAALGAACITIFLLLRTRSSKPRDHEQPA